MATMIRTADLPHLFAEEEITRYIERVRTAWPQLAAHGDETLRSIALIFLRDSTEAWIMTLFDCLPSMVVNINGKLERMAP